MAQPVGWVGIGAVACLCFITVSSSEADPGLASRATPPPPTLRSHPPDVLTRVFLKSPCAPSCPAGSDIEVQATVSGLVPGARYNVAFFVAQELRLVFVSAKQVTRASDSSHDPVYAAHLHVSIPPLQPGLFTVGAVVYDAFPGLEEDESFLTRFVTNVDINYVDINFSKCSNSIPVSAAAAEEGEKEGTPGGVLLEQDSKRLGSAPGHIAGAFQVAGKCCEKHDGGTVVRRILIPDNLHLHEQAGVPGYNFRNFSFIRHDFRLPLCVDDELGGTWESNSTAWIDWVGRAHREIGHASSVLNLPGLSAGLEGGQHELSDGATGPGKAGSTCDDAGMSECVHV